MEDLKKDFSKTSGDIVESVEIIDGFYRLITAGHSFLAVKKNNLFYNIATKIKQASCYGYRGNIAVYLEEDCQMPEFLNRLPKSF